VRLQSRYLFVGVWNTLFGIVIFLVVSLGLPGWSDGAVLTVSYSLSVIQSHFSQRRFVWRSETPYLPEFLRFTTGYLIQFAINLFLLVASQGMFLISREIRQIVVFVFIAILFYFVNKKGVFRVNQ